MGDARKYIVLGNICRCLVCLYVCNHINMSKCFVIETVCVNDIVHDTLVNGIDTIVVVMTTIVIVMNTIVIAIYTMVIVI